jgi:NADH-quinone oxidoreductase subunit N
MKPSLSAVDFLAFLPQTVLIVMGMVVVLFDLFGRGRGSRGLAYLSLLSLAMAAYAQVAFSGATLVGFGGSVTSDAYATAFNLVFLIVTALTVLLSFRYLDYQGLERGEYYALLLFACAGMMIMASALDLLMIFIGLEILSISSYILCGIVQRDPRSTESAMKYFLLGAFATGFLLYGIAMLYGATGSIQLREIHAALAKEAVYSNTYIWLGLGLILVGFGFKIALVPFHMWTPDVYEGAPTPITAFLSTGPKAAGFAALARILVEGLSAAQVEWSAVLWVLAVLTMTLGNVIAIQQTNIKRMLAYSSIAHAGYILAALVVGGPEGLSAVLFYTLAYAFMNTGAFAILILASARGKERLVFSDYAGFGFVEPAVALAMFLFMLSLAGIPLTGGFTGKFQIFKAAIDQGYIWLAVIGVLNSVVSIYYYLRIVVVMYMQPAEPGSLSAPAPASVPLYAAIAVSALGVLYLGVFPSSVLELSLRSVAILAAR